MKTDTDTDWVTYTLDDGQGSEVTVSVRVRVTPDVKVLGDVTFGDHVSIGAKSKLVVRGGSLEIASGVTLGEKVKIVATGTVQIGKTPG